MLLKKKTENVSDSTGQTGFTESDLETQYVWLHIVKWFKPALGMV